VLPPKAWDSPDYQNELLREADEAEANDEQAAIMKSIPAAPVSNPEGGSEIRTRE